MDDGRKRAKAKETDRQTDRQTDRRLWFVTIKPHERKPSWIDSTGHQKMLAYVQVCFVSRMPKSKRSV